MAVTKIWDIKGNIGQLLNYASNHGKTSETLVVEYTESDIMDMTDLMDFAMLDDRAMEFDRGDRFEVVVATHIDKGHVHTHFVLNSVSFVDGKKYNDCKATYMTIRHESDALCREYGLSVIENPERDKIKHYSEWDAERKGQPTYRSMVKSDLDTCIHRSMTESQFFDKLRKLGYDIKPGKDISVKAFGRERFVRLERSFGEDYSIDGIRRRILAQTRPEVSRPYQESKKTYKFKGVFHKPHRRAGLRALYIYYLYRLGAIPKGREPDPKQIYYVFREDIRYIRRI